MARWPWVMTILTPLLALTPLARDIFYSAFISSERWMQDFWQFVYGAGVAIAILLGFIEWGIRVMLIRRRVRLQAVTGEHKTES